MPIDNYLTTKELAERWSMCPGTLDNWRTADLGPRYEKKGWAVFYCIEEVKRYEKLHPKLLQRKNRRV